MAGQFVQVIQPTAVTTAIDIFEILCPSDAGIIILEWEIYQINVFGDANEEVIQVESVRGVGSVTSGSGGSTGTPEARSVGGTSGATVEILNTTRLAVGTGTLDIMDSRGWNIRAERNHVSIPEVREEIAPGGYWTLSLDDAPAAASITLGGKVVWQELFG